MKLVDYAIEEITAFSNTPLGFATYVGMFIASLSFLYLLYILFDPMVSGNSTASWPSIVCIMLCLIVIGEHIGCIYNEVKQQPIYIVKELVK